MHYQCARQLAHSISAVISDVTVSDKQTEVPIVELSKVNPRT